MDSKLFEEDVRRIARYRWPEAEHAGSEMYAGRERDGIFITEDCVHLVECTTSRELAKAEKDLQKLHELAKAYRSKHTDKAIKCWFVTLHDPTADQRNARKTVRGAPENLFNVVSFAQFQAKLIDTHEYLRDREEHRFGSVYDPKTGNTTAKVDYVEAGLNCVGETATISTEFVANSLLAGGRYVLLGEFGIGKSMTLREVFRHLAAKHRRATTLKFPIYLNLREHQSQQNAAEILERHARNIGYPNPAQLVRAWKAGYAILLLDGFDEVSSLGLQGAWRRLRDARHASMTGLRQLVIESPESTGIAIAGRDHFFDTDEERRAALCLNTRWKEIRLDEFNEDQIQKLISHFGFSGPIPGWVPSRPLLLATLFGRGLGTMPLSMSQLDDASLGWDLLLTEVCKREARIEHGISGEHVRGMLEALATVARSKDSGVGPLTSDEIIKVFESISGLPPDDQALSVIQRLPGLGRAPSANDNSRVFVDVDFADACRAGDFVHFCLNPFELKETNPLISARIAIRNTGIGVAARILQTQGLVSGHVLAALTALDKLRITGATSVDVMNLALRLKLPIPRQLVVSKLFIDTLELESNTADLHNLTFSECYFDELEIAPNISADNCPQFDGCLIQRLIGRVSTDDLPRSKFIDCVFESFGSTADTTSGALDLSIPVGARVLLTVLKKLFAQSLSGRKENGLYRGLDAQHQAKVGGVLKLLTSHGLATTSGRAGEPIWMPIRRHRSRVLAMLASPTSNNDPLLQAARKL